MSKANVLPYILLMHRVRDEECTLEEFALAFIELFRNESENFDAKVFNVINDISLDADEYVPSISEGFDELRDKYPGFTIDDNEFSKRIKTALAKLEGYGQQG